MTSQSFMRMNQEVRRHTRQSPAHSPGLLPARVDSTKAPQAGASTFEAASGPMLLAENVLPHPLQGHRWEPSVSWPFLMREGEPQRGAARRSGVAAGRGVFDSLVVARKSRSAFHL